MSVDAWKTELARLDANVADARASGGSARAAVVLRLLHLQNKPEEEPEEPEQEKEEEKKKQWYAGYFELKKALDDYIATKPAD